MHRRRQRWTKLGLAALALASVLAPASARADAPSVALYYGPEDGPFVELLGAELGLVGFELRPGPVPAPIDETEALALFEETDAAALLDHHRGVVALWILREGRAHRAEIPVSDDPGIAPLVIAETLRAVTAPAETPFEAPRHEPAWTPPPPRIAAEPAAPLRTEPSDSRPGLPRLTLSVGPTALYGGRWQGGATLEGMVRLHPALSVGALALVAGAPAGAALVRVDGRVGRVRLSVDAGPAVWWRARPRNDGSLRLTADPAWTAGVGATVALGERWMLGGRLGLLRAGPRHRAPGDRGALTLALGLGARF